MLLNGTFSLLGIQDVEAFTGGIVQRSGLRLSVEDREELHVWLVEECWLLSRRYQPQPSGITFSSWAAHKLRLRVIDWQRSRFGRTRWQFAGRVYERERPRLVSLDAGDSLRDRVDAALRSRTGNPEDDRDSAFGGLDEDRDRQRARDLATLGL